MKSIYDHPVPIDWPAIVARWFRAMDARSPLERDRERWFRAYVADAQILHFAPEDTLSVIMDRAIGRLASLGAEAGHKLEWQAHAVCVREASRHLEPVNHRALAAIVEPLRLLDAAAQSSTMDNVEWRAAHWRLDEEFMRLRCLGRPGDRDERVALYALSAVDGSRSNSPAIWAASAAQELCGSIVAGEAAMIRILEAVCAAVERA